MLILQVPVHRLADATFIFLGVPPTEFGFQLGRVDRIALVVPRPVLDELNLRRIRLSIHARL